mgnify:CR=1 FL=1
MVYVKQKKSKVVVSPTTINSTNPIPKTDGWNSKKIIQYKKNQRSELRGRYGLEGVFVFFTKKRSFLLNFYVFYVIMLL